MADRRYEREVIALDGRCEAAVPLSTADLDGDDAGDALALWLLDRAHDHRALALRWLLAHLDDAVVWGRVERDDEGARPEGLRLVTSYDALAHAPDASNGDPDGRGLQQRFHDARRASAPLRARTLQHARLFGEGGELLLWRDGDNALHARLIGRADALPDGETAGPRHSGWTEAFNEPQMLWGSERHALADGFMMWAQGAAGLLHALPTAETAEARRGPVRAHYPPRLVVRHLLAPEGLARVEASRLVGFDLSAF